MADEQTVTILSTTTITSTKTLTRTLFNSLGTFLPGPTDDHVLNGADVNREIHLSSYPSLYPYRPSLPLAVIFTILYFIITVHHGYLSLYLPTRPECLSKHRYTIPLFIASLLSTLGYLTRSISIQRPNVSHLSLFTASTALIIISPIFLCATVYLLLTRLITRCLPSTTAPTPTVLRSQFPIPKPPNLQKFIFLTPTLLGILFITSDIISFLTQATGAAIAASNNWSEPQLSQGTHTLLAGLTLQLATFIVFLAIFHRFYTRVRNSASHGFNPCIMRVVTATWVSSGFVLIRTLFRLIEFAMGPHGYPFLHEWTLYIFEAFPVWVALAVLGWWHPVKWVQERVFSAAAILAQEQTRAKAALAAQGPGSGVGMVVRKPVAGSVSSGGGEAEGHVRKRSHVGFAL